MIVRIFVATTLIVAGFAASSQTFAFDNRLSKTWDGNSCSDIIMDTLPWQPCWIEPWHCTTGPHDFISTVSPIQHVCQIYEGQENKCGSSAPGRVKNKPSKVGFGGSSIATEDVVGDHREWLIADLSPQE